MKKEIQIKILILQVEIALNIKYKYFLKSLIILYNNFLALILYFQFINLFPHRIYPVL